MGNSKSKGGSQGSTGSQARQYQRSTTYRFRAIRDQFETVEEVQAALRKQGLESSQLIVGIDFTKSNEWTGKSSFFGRSLHQVGAEWPNPYEQAATAIGRTLAAFDDDNLIPCYGFGDAITNDRAVFSFFENDRPANGLSEMVARYRHIAQHVQLAGPTSFAPIVQQAMRVVMSNMQYHILVLIADGQVTRSSDLPAGQLSVQEQQTVDAIVAASYLPLSIIMVGVGDGPWDMMREFDDSLPQRQFDNFQFVCWTDVVRESPGLDAARLEAAFALRALMEIPDQYRAIQQLGLLNGKAPNMRVPGSAPLPPPPSVRAADAPAAPAAGGAYPSVQPHLAHQTSNMYGSASPYAGAAPSIGDTAPLAPANIGSKPDPHFLCPITQEVMDEPMMAADGYTYEATAIQGWLKNHNTSPMTNAPMPHLNLIPNHGLRSAIREWQGR